MNDSFNCMACGAPVNAQPGEDVMPCPYCDTTLTIPLHLRRARPVETDNTRAGRPRDPFSAAASVRLDDKTRERSALETEMLAGALRTAQPFARGAARFYNYFVLAKYFLPGVLAALVVACLAGCGIMGGIVFFLSRQ